MARKAKENEPIVARAGTINLSAGEAAELVQGAVSGIHQHWLQAAVTLSYAIKNGQSIGLGNIEDLRRLREQFEELERARLMLQSLEPHRKPETEAACGKGDGDEDAPVL